MVALRLLNLFSFTSTSIKLSFCAPEKYVHQVITPRSLFCNRLTVSLCFLFQGIRGFNTDYLKYLVRLCDFLHFLPALVFRHGIPGAFAKHVKVGDYTACFLVGEYYGIIWERICIRRRMRRRRTSGKS